MFRFIALPIVGFLIGLIIISFGGGGGAFYVGILTAFFNIPPSVAASTSLATMIPTTATGAFSHGSFYGRNSGHKPRSDMRHDKDREGESQHLQDLRAGGYLKHP